MTRSAACSTRWRPCRLPRNGKETRRTAYSRAHNCDGAESATLEARRCGSFSRSQASPAEFRAIHRGSLVAFNASMMTAEMTVWDAAVEQGLRALDAKLGRATCEASAARARGAAIRAGTASARAASGGRSLTTPQLSKARSALQPIAPGLLVSQRACPLYRTSRPMRTQTKIDLSNQSMRTAARSSPGERGSCEKHCRGASVWLASPPNRV
jgi:hypothetical protein